MATQVAILVQRPWVNDGDSMVINAYFRDRATGEADTPTTVEFRIDCLTTRTRVVDWTVAAVGDAVALAIRSSYNSIIRVGNLLEHKQITVVADRGLSSQVAGQATWDVKTLNLTPV